MVIRCDHPEWPAVALLLRQASVFTAALEGRDLQANLAPAGPMVRSGDVLRLWKREEFLRIAVVGVAEENGELGRTIRVRLARRSSNDSPIEEHLLGIVRGPSSAEIRP